MALYLYYDNKKGFVKSKDYAVGNYIVEHDEKGSGTPLCKQTLEVPSRNVKIEVRTKLHSGAKSYMCASISLMDKCVLNFIDTRLNFSVSTVHVKPGNWDELFEGIIKLYNTIFNSESPINEYFDVIEEAINEPNGICGNNLNNAIARLSEIADNLLNSIYADNPIVDFRMKKACHLLIRRIMDMDFSNGTSMWVKEMRSIFNYLAEREEIVAVIAGV